MGRRVARTALDEGWSNPPVQARLCAYWWWLNGNVTQEAITKDLKWMTASGVWNGLVIDYLDADALRWYWHAVVDPLIADAGPLVGRTWKMVQTDSWELGGVNWTATFPAEFNKRRGYDLRSWLGRPFQPLYSNHAEYRVKRCSILNTPKR